jgi:hypothetical protein
LDSRQALLDADNPNAVDHVCEYQTKAEPLAERIG